MLLKLRLSIKLFKDQFNLNWESVKINHNLKII
jgi:hypothetical protein